MGGHRAFGAGDDLVDGPVDLAAVRADDALLDAIAGGALSGGADAFTGGDVFGRPGQDDDHLAAILAAWKADIEAEPMPELVDLDEASEAVEAGHAARDRRASRTRRRMPFAVAAAAMAVALSGLGVAVHSAQPGDAMFGLTKVLFSQQADNAQKTQQVRETIVAANDAIARGDRATAQSLLQSAGSQIQAVRADDQPPLVQQRQDVLKSLDPTAPAAPSSESASNAPGEPEGTTKGTKPGKPAGSTEVSPTTEQTPPAGAGTTTDEPRVATPPAGGATDTTTTTPVPPGN